MSDVERFFGDGPEEPEEPQPLDPEHEPEHEPAPLRRRGRSGLGCLIALVLLAVVAGGAWYGGSALIDRVKGHFASAPDYPGPGSGSVLVQVRPGDSSTVIAQELKTKGVTESVQSFVDAARSNPQSTSIQVGFYQLRKQMKASEALAVLVDHKNLIQAAVTIPEGFTVDQIVARLADKTKFSAKRYRAVLKHPATIGVPSYARGSAEGYLYPSTYNVLPNSTPKTILAQMVAQWQKVADEEKLQSGAKARGYTPQQIMTVASILEQEVNTSSDRFKVARVIYNRLEGTATGGLLQLDTTVDYGASKPLSAHPSSAQVDDTTGPYATPYNTYIHPGLPPGPIDNPSQESINAALHPASGNWIYYVTTNLDTGATLFTDSYKEFLKGKQQFIDYCNTHAKVCGG